MDILYCLIKESIFFNPFCVLSSLCISSSLCFLSSLRTCIAIGKPPGLTWRWGEKRLADWASEEHSSLFTLIFEWSSCWHWKLQWLSLLEWCWWQEVFFSVTSEPSPDSVALGPCQSRSKISSSINVTCILCQEEETVSHTSRAMVLAAYVQMWVMMLWVYVWGGGGVGEEGGQCSFCQVEETVLWVVGRGEEGSVLSHTSYTPLLCRPPNKPNKVDWGYTAISLWCWLLRLMYRVYLFQSVSVWLSWIFNVSLQYMNASQFQCGCPELSGHQCVSTMFFFFSFFSLCLFMLVYCHISSCIWYSVQHCVGIRKAGIQHFFLFSFFTGLVRESERFGRHVLQVHSAVPEPQQTPSQRGAVWPALDVCWPLQWHPHLFLRPLYAPRVLAEVRWLSTLEYSTTPLPAVTACTASAGRGKVAQYSTVQHLFLQSLHALQVLAEVRWLSTVQSGTSSCSHWMHHECWQR